MSSTDSVIHVAQDLIYSLHNPAPAISLVKLGNSHKEALRPQVDIFEKANSPKISSRVSVRGAYQEKLQQVNQERTQITSRISVSNTPRITPTDEPRKKG